MQHITLVMGPGCFDILYEKAMPTVCQSVGFDWAGWDGVLCGVMLCVMRGQCVHGPPHSPLAMPHTKNGVLRHHHHSDAPCHAYHTVLHYTPEYMLQSVRKAIVTSSLARAAETTIGLLATSSATTQTAQIESCIAPYPCVQGHHNSEDNSCKDSLQDRQFSKVHK